MQRDVFNRRCIIMPLSCSLHLIKKNKSLPKHMVCEKHILKHLIYSSMPIVSASGRIYFLYSTLWDLFLTTITSMHLAKERSPKSVCFRDGVRNQPGWTLSIAHAHQRAHLAGLPLNPHLDSGETVVASNAPLWADIVRANALLEHPSQSGTGYFQPNPMRT